MKLTCVMLTSKSVTVEAFDRGATQLKGEEEIKKHYSLIDKYFT